MRPAVLGIVAAAALALPQMARACFQLSDAIWMCAADTAWAEATWDPYGDGATLNLGDYLLNFTDNWPGAEIRDDLTTLEEQFATYAELTEADGNPPVEVHSQELLELPVGKAFRSLQRDRYDDVETVSAVMLVEISAARLMIYLDGPETLDWPQIDSESRVILAALRDSCADTTTCATPDQTKIDTE